MKRTGPDFPTGPQSPWFYRTIRVVMFFVDAWDALKRPFRRR
jgi:hypothetical protein